jgi:hypothetical protein
MFAAIDFRIAPPGFLHIAASLLQHIRGVEPALQVSTAKLAFLVLLVAGPLSRLLDLDLVVGKLRRSQCARGRGCGQKVHPLFERLSRGIQLRSSILLEAFCGTPDLQDKEKTGAPVA